MSANWDVFSGKSQLNVDLPEFAFLLSRIKSCPLPSCFELNLRDQKGFVFFKVYFVSSDYNYGKIAQ